MKRYVFYYYTRQGGITIYGYDADGKYRRIVYLGYSLHEALQKFRLDYNLRYKHLCIQKL